MLQPLNEMVLVEPDENKIERENVTAGGIVLTKKKEERFDLATARGTVLAIGDCVAEIKVGDRVIYNYFSGNAVLEFGTDPEGKDDKEFHLVTEDDILALEVKNG